MTKTRIMAILNITPDSFSDGGRFNTDESVVEAARSALAAGADILDIGGESTRPGAASVPVESEINRVIPAIHAIRDAFPEAVISVDTRKAPVAAAAIEAGASIINDVSGLQYDPEIAKVAASHQAGLIIMHSQGTPETMQNHPDYPRGVIPEILSFFQQQTEIALTAGVSKDAIVLDPGFGFGKTLQHNLDILKNLRQFKELGYPLLVGTSRKRFLTLGESSPPAHEREALTAASLAEAIRQGTDWVRIHDIQTQAPVVRFLDKLYR